MKYTPAHSLPLIEPATDLIRSASGDNLWKQLNASMTAVDTALTKELASTVRFRGPLPSGADLNTYQGEAYAGIWSAPTSGIVASLLNAPPGLNPFTIEVQPNTNGITMQVLSSYGSTFGTWSRSTNSLAGNTWTPWKQDAYKGENPVATLADGTDLNTLRDFGDYQVLTSGKAATMLNTPDANPFLLQVRPMVGQNIVEQALTSSGGSGNKWYRITNSVTNGTWIPWRPLHVPVTESAGPYQRETLVSAFKQRRGGALGTNGRPAVALRFDHGLANFRDILLPLLRKYNLPWSQAVNSRNIARAENGGATWTQLEDWAIAYGGEVWNHGATHEDATSETALTSEIVTGLAELRTAMPRLAVEGWAPPGIADGGYMGAAGFDKPEQFHSTYAGRLMLAHHAAVSGYVPGPYRPMPQDLPIGATHVTMDKAAASTMRNILDAVKTSTEPVALQLMLHPSLVGTDTYISAATVDEVFADIARRRDAGEIVVLTPSGLMLADHRTANRHNLIVDGNFTEGFAKWSNTTGYAVATEKGLSFAQTTTGTPLTQTIPLYRKEALAGSARELVAMVRTSGTAVVRLRAASAGGLDTGKDVTITAAQGWVEIRQALVIPATANADTIITATIGRLSGSRVDLRNVRLESI